MICLEIAPPALLLIWVLCGVVHAPFCWDRLRGRRRSAAGTFGIASLATNRSTAFLSIYAQNMWGMAGMFLASLCGIPLTLGFGAAWAYTGNRDGSRSFQWQCRADHRPGPCGSLGFRPSRRRPSRAHRAWWRSPLQPVLGSEIVRWVAVRLRGLSARSEP
jgi:hypothetical protein